MRKLLALLLILSLASAAITLEFQAPEEAEKFGPGTITTEVRVLNDGSALTNGTVHAFLLNEGGGVLSTNEMELDGNDYTTAFVVVNKGNYSFRAQTVVSGETYTATQAFYVKSSKIVVGIISPTANSQLQPGAIKIEASVQAGNEVAKNVNVEADIYKNNALIATHTLPAGQNSYYKVITLTEPGLYQVEVTATDKSLSSNRDEASVAFLIEGTVQTDSGAEPVTGVKPMHVQKITPDKGQYPLGSTLEVQVNLIDTNTGLKIADENAVVTATITTVKGTQEITLEIENPLTLPRYTGTVLLNENEWYEVTVDASVEQYTDARARFSPFKVGEDPQEPPEGALVLGDVWLSVISPKMITYSVEQSIEFRVQILDNASFPITDAEVSVDIPNNTGTLLYDRNGEYTFVMPPISAGEYTATFRVEYDDKVLEQETTFVVSEKRLQIKTVRPSIGEEVTENNVVISAEVLNEFGDIAPEVNVRAVINTPNKGSHTVDLKRNLRTGRYENSYALADSGTYTVRIIASKQEYVSTQTEFSFVVALPESELLGLDSFESNDIMLAAIVIGGIIVILTVGKIFL